MNQHGTTSVRSPTITKLPAKQANALRRATDMTAKHTPHEVTRAKDVTSPEDDQNQKDANKRDPDFRQILCKSSHAQDVVKTTTMLANARKIQAP